MGSLNGCLGGLAAVIVAIIGIAAADAIGVYPIEPDEVSPPTPVAQTVVGPLPDLQPALPVPAAAVSATPSATPTPTPAPTPTETPTAAPTTQPTSQPTQTAPPPTHTPPPPTPTPQCRETYSSTITYTDDSGSHTLSGGPTWTYNETQPQGDPVSATINQFTACNGDHLVFTITDHSNNYSCYPKMQPPISVSIHTYASPETVTITARFGSGC